MVITMRFIYNMFMCLSSKQVDGTGGKEDSLDECLKLWMPNTCSLLPISVEVQSPGQYDRSLFEELIHIPYPKNHSGKTG